MNLIKKAFEEKCCISFNYNGYHRVVEPHCYGVGASGNELLRGFQVGGGSESGEPYGWKLFKSDEIYGLQLSESPAALPRQGYKRGDKAMRNIYCQV